MSSVRVGMSIPYTLLYRTGGAALAKKTCMSGEERSWRIKDGSRREERQGGRDGSRGEEREGESRGQKQFSGKQRHRKNKNKA